PLLRRARAKSRPTQSCEEIDGHSLPVSALIYACMLELIASRMQSVISLAVSALMTNSDFGRYASVRLAAFVTAPSGQQPLKRPVVAQLLRTGWPQSLSSRADSQPTS